MKKTEIKKQMEALKIEHLESFKNLLQDVKKELLKHNNKTFRSPLKDEILNNLKEVLKEKYNNSFITIYNNNLYISYDFYFSYYNFEKLFLNYSNLRWFSSEKEKHYYTTTEKTNYNYNIIFESNKIINNNIDDILKDLDHQIEKNNNKMLTFDQDMENLEKYYNLICETREKFNNINHETRAFFGSDGGCDYIPSFKNNYFKNYNYYYLSYDFNFDVEKMIDNLESSKFYLNNQKNIYNINIIDDHYLELYFFKYKHDENIETENKIIYDLINNNIVYNNFDSLIFNNFDNLDRLSDDDFSGLEKKAKNKMLKLKNNDNLIFNKNDFKISDEICFISSNDLHGFYFPNLFIKYHDVINNINYKFLAIAFLNGEAVAVFDSEKDGSLLVL